MGVNRKTVKVGDVFQILTSEGICYGQVTHTHPKYEFIVRIFREFYPTPPKKFEEVVSKEPQFTAMFLVQDAVRQGLVSLVANVPVATKNKSFPIFRTTNNYGEGDNTIWWFWDGDKEWRVDRSLTDVEKKYPQRGFISAPLLIERIEKDYRAEIDYV